jgi:hypothetical protein
MTLLVTAKMVLIAVSFTMLIVSSIRDKAHPESYYYKGGTYVSVGSK